MKRIGLHGVARSGTTWIGNIFNSNPFVTYKHQPLFSYKFKNMLTNDSRKSDIVHFFDKISRSTDDYTNQLTLIEEGLVPKFKKSDNKDIIVYKEARHHHIVENLLTEDVGFMLVGIIRNPLATLWSWKNAPNEFKDMWDFNQEWRYARLKNEGLPENFYGYEKWKEAAHIFEKVNRLYPDRVHLINYSDFIANPKDETHKMFDKLNIPIHQQVIEFLSISNSETKGPYSVFREKTKDDGWVGNIHDDIVDFIKNDLSGTELEKYLK